MFCAKYFGSEMSSLSWQGFHFTAEMEMSILARSFNCWNMDVISTCFYQCSCVQVLERFGFRKNEIELSLLAILIILLTILWALIHSSFYDVDGKHISFVGGKVIFPGGFFFYFRIYVIVRQVRNNPLDKRSLF